MPEMGWGILGGILVLIGLSIHLKASKMAKNALLKRLKTTIREETLRESLMRAFQKNTSTGRSLFMWIISEPTGWGDATRKQIYSILSDVNGYVKKLNDRFTNPSGKQEEKTVDATSEEATTE
jgi:hypothetical protein